MIIRYIYIGFIITPQNETNHFDFENECVSDLIVHQAIHDMNHDIKI